MKRSLQKVAFFCEGTIVTYIETWLCWFFGKLEHFTARAQIYITDFVSNLLGRKCSGCVSDL